MFLYHGEFVDTRCPQFSSFGVARTRPEQIHAFYIETSRSSSQPSACTHLGSLANVSTGRRVDSANLCALRKASVHNTFTCYSSIVEYWLDIYIHWFSTARVSSSPNNPHLKGSSHNSKVFYFLISPSFIP